MNMSSPLTSADDALFARFKIPSELISMAGIFRVSDVEARTFGFQYWDSSNLAGLVFPYFDPITGSRVTARLRRDLPDVDEKGRPKAKYLSPRGDTRHLYFPLGVGGVLADAKVPIAFVEAQKSALALLAWAGRTGSNLLPIGTGGCWGWRGKIGADDENQDRERRGALPDFNRVHWSDRTVHIIFDADVATNPRVKYARQAIARELIGRGAKVHFVNLPQNG